MDVTAVAIHQLIEKERIDRSDIASTSIESVKMLQPHSAEVIVRVVMNDDSSYAVPVRARVHYEAIFEYCSAGGER